MTRPLVHIVLFLTSEWASEGALFLLGKGYQLLVLPVLLWILNLFLGILMGIAPLFSSLLPKKAGLDALSLVQPGEPPVFEAVEMGEPSMVWRVVGWALVAAALFAFLYLLYRKLSGNGYGKRERMEGALSREKAVSFASRTGKRRTLFGEHDVRYFYRKFLMLCKKKGLDMEANLTTAEVEQMARLYWKKEDTGELRDLYRKARYGRPGEREKDAADRRRAGELYREMKKEET